MRARASLGARLLIGAAVWITLALALAAVVAVFRFRVGMLPVLGACAAAGVGLRLAGLI